MKGRLEKPKSVYGAIRALLHPGSLGKGKGARLKRDPVSFNIMVMSSHRFSMRLVAGIMIAGNAQFLLVIGAKRSMQVISRAGHVSRER